MSPPEATTGPARRLPGPPTLTRPRRGGAIPGLRYRPAVPADPAKVQEVDRRLEAWARELDLFPPAWKGDFAGFQFGRAVVLQHPRAVDLDRLTLAGELLLAENLVDSCYCEEDEGRGGSHRGLGGPLIISQSAIDPFHSTPELEAEWQRGVQADGPLRSYHWAMKDYTTFATPSQCDRFVHDIARLHLGYLAEAAWAETRHVPRVWEYLVMRQFNNFRPCLSIVDAVDGYELPEFVYARPEIQRITALACNATTIVNDLYSFAKEMASDPDHLNLPQVVAANEGEGLKAAYLRSVDIHNEVMAAFEEEAAALSATSLVVERYALGLSDWLAGNHEWHATNSHRYHLPDYW
ncbi:family 2 encapsulin nanocompartment cargo protein terpene cyclase [Actinacidiphila bryophytorum]|uniref:Terpene synthase n=1 Tax=Actinacidiphila bryophytorum TaxID=1436133 RepID=A0A9W4MJD6_9ACTN|nr:family 2 encapsulin nanocompartment cargo protein terpene cyclase [Actinacidiphila bryophytorum]MBM9436735.1 cyclase [Actinacidiphila bryophytorum]MBN6546055.1 cyclase [Actinacidiphila bryophytorum]CAG7654164.1 2-methylisoborneol synthase [Actinacidiphila bryophytorum]